MKYTGIWGPAFSNLLMNRPFAVNYLFGILTLNVKNICQLNTKESI